MKYRHIVFDIDGTMTDTEYAAIVSLQEVVMAKLSKAYAYDDLKFTLGIPGVDALRQLGFSAEEAPAVMGEWEKALRRHNAEIGVFEGIDELTAALAEMGCALGVATSKTRDQYIKDFERFEVSKRFAVSVTCDDSKAHKPTAGPLLRYMELTGAKREEMLYVGDSIYDSQCAANAGVDFALAVWGAPDKTVEAKYRPQTPTALLDVIR